MAFTHVFVTVGTTNFDKLISSITEYSSLRELKERGCKELVLQIGEGSEPKVENTSPIKVTWFRFKPTITDEISQASLVIAHAGAGTCLDVLTAGKPLLVVANQDLMDAHQDELASKMYSLNYLAYTTPQKLAQTLSNLDLSTLIPYTPGNPAVFASFIDSVVGIKS